MSDQQPTVAVDSTTKINKVASGNGNKPAPSAAQHAAIPQRESKIVKEALLILRGGQETPQRMLELATKLKAELRFGYARRLLLRASQHKDTPLDKKLREKIYQQLALCTYKDQDLPADDRLDRALDILREIADFATTTVQETLGLIGAVYKRRWEIDNQRENLEQSLIYYLRGYEQGPRNDQGYTGINAAYILDRLASLEEAQARKAGRDIVDDERREQARAIRERIVKEVGSLIDEADHKWLNDKWWYYAAVAEAHFGLQNYEDAVKWIRAGQAAAGQVYEWELETCSRQLASIACLQRGEDLGPAWDAIKRAFDVDAVPRSAFTGKVGLAMSGGGFRASLYHIGVLAQLAELDLLRKVEVLSCVSGGSIVGAHYYLKVRHLLQTKTDEEITREDYIKLVHEMIDEFVAGVQKNIRTRVAVNPLKNFRIFVACRVSPNRRRDNCPRLFMVGYAFTALDRATRDGRHNGIGDGCHRADFPESRDLHLFSDRDDACVWSVGQSSHRVVRHVRFRARHRVSALERHCETNSVGAHHQHDRLCRRRASYLHF
jgi:hypothetical protein